MGSFEEHLDVARLPAAGLGVVVTWSVLWLTGSSVYAFALGAAGAASVLVGASVPDVDHHASKPNRWLTTGVKLAAGSGVLYLVFLFDVDRAVPNGLLAVLCVFVVLAVMTRSERLVEHKRPPHRTVTHTLWAGVVVGGSFGVGIGVLGWIYDVPGTVDLAAVVGVGLFVGVATHLALDGLLDPVPADDVTADD
ncbi:metal-dependent hydrolase [Salinigranum salinum]|uniref:metal-dependent hydrolase n=1 Tax=Salinigranum salinum TaxID=1364937 RepID=UPI00126085D6|nr:metal-dependent hydrolase [Salinigranum salinum]